MQPSTKHKVFLTPHPPQAVFVFSLPPSKPLVLPPPSSEGGIRREVTDYAPFFKQIRGEEKGHRICKPNRRVTRRRTQVRREVRFADSKRHYNQNLCTQIFTLKNTSSTASGPLLLEGEGDKKPYAFCGLCSFSSRHDFVVFDGDTSIRHIKGGLLMRNDNQGFSRKCF